MVEPADGFPDDDVVEAFCEAEFDGDEPLVEPAALGDEPPEPVPEGCAAVEPSCVDDVPEDDAVPDEGCVEPPCVAPPADDEPLAADDGE